MNNSISKLTSFVLLPIAIYSVQRFSYSPIGTTTIWWLVQFIILLIFFISIYFNYEAEPDTKKAIVIFKLYLTWNIVSIFRAYFFAETYWDWKGLINNGFSLLLPIVVFIATNKVQLQSMLSFFFKFVLPLAIPILIPLSVGTWGWYLFPVCFIVPFLPALKFQWKVIILVIVTIVSLGDLTARSHILKYGIPVVLLLIYYFRAFLITKKTIVILHKSLIIAPWLLFFLATSGVFNVFKMDDYISGVDTQSTDEKQSLIQDSRTFIYKEVLNSAIKYDYWLLGRSPARGNETAAFADLIKKETGRDERLLNEPNIANVFNWQGLVGVLLYFLIFLKSSSLAVNRSNNIYVKILGLYVSFRWLYSWVEDAYLFDMNNLTIWLMLGACFSSSFREMDDLEVKIWARGIFDKRYLTIYRSYYLDHNLI